MLNFTSPEIMALLGKLWWPFFRITAALWLMPFFGDTRITPLIRILFSLTLAIIIAPVVPSMPTSDPFSLTSIIFAVEQILFGLIFGLSLTLLFSMMQLVGEMLSMQMAVKAEK